MFKVLGREASFPPSLKDLVCVSILTQTIQGLPQDLVDYLEEYKRRKFISISFISDGSGMAMAFIKHGRKNGPSYDVTSLERVCVVFSVNGYEVKIDLLLSSLKETLSVVFCDFNLFVKHGNNFAAMHVLEREKHLKI
ncbi:Hypothetical protein BQ3484_508 [Cedratvirus A11]|uniref:Uncharacterized protein n=1 Tax=Cedratvirus A11 TaxID=1903266 RepID=A0A1M7XV66_9VIRU|nr:Hypothetical protein BQ3484_508 [Cedratvirus A11]SHO33576.1 Hypothetical protein BQ3484_508 [Cedratvirus A11]